MQEGPASGLRRQHQFTKVATGWTESAIAEGVSNTIGGFDEMDGFSAAQIDALKAHVISDQAPADAQAVAEGEATAWGMHWKVGREVEEVKWPNEGMVPPELTEHMLLKAAVSFPDHTGSAGTVCTRGY